jgi:AcrR family transcriptional regulator
MTQPQRPSTRVEAMARTRIRIVDAARDLLPSGATMPVDAIADRAGVSVQTLYSHFGSKRGLLLAVIDSVQQDAGLYADFEVVWSSPDGETALRRMLEATIRIWDSAWTIVEFAERARRVDPEIQVHLREVDGYRRSNLVSIAERLAAEGRLRAGRDAATAADLAFSLSLPAVYEELALVRGWPLARVVSAVTESVATALIDPTTVAVLDPAADWSSVVRPPDIMARG